jgi:hypothetical protein
MATSRRALFRKRSAHMREVCTSIGCQFHAEYLPILTEPLPLELKALVARLAALEPQRSREAAVKSLQYAGAQAELPPDEPGLNRAKL